MICITTFSNTYMHTSFTYQNQKRYGAIYKCDVVQLATPLEYSMHTDILKLTTSVVGAPLECKYCYIRMYNDFHVFTTDCHSIAIQS